MPRQQINRAAEIWTPSGKNPNGSVAYIIRPYADNMQGGEGDEYHELPSLHIAWNATEVRDFGASIDVQIEVDMEWMARQREGDRT